MNIVYPPLVEQMYEFMHKKDKSLTKQDVYKKAIEINMIDQQGNPTQWALDKGYISEVPQSVENATPDADLNNIFSRMPKEAFKYLNEHDGYAIDNIELKKAILSALKDGSLSRVGRKNWLEVLAKINSRED